MKILRTLVEDGKPLLLRRRRGALELVLGNVVLLSSAALETEQAFGRLAKGGRIVVGGLGFGATLRGVLEVAPRGARVLVVEKLAAVIDLARKEARDLIGGALDDPRVTLEHTDVAEVIARERRVTTLLLDIDNGPEWASFRTNARLYASPWLERARAALEPGGTLAVWSGYPADQFVGRLRDAGFAPRIEPLREYGVVRARAYVGVKSG